MISFTEAANGLLALALVEPEECRSIVDHIETVDGWGDATVRAQGSDDMYDSVAPHVRSASVVPLVRSPEILHQFEEKMAKLIKPLIAQFWGVDLEEHSGLQIVRYKPGGRYQTHQDAAMDFEDRYFTVICYLNDDFEGGCTQFPNLNHTVVPESGKAIVFPAKYFHCAEPVVRGEKYVLVGWVLGPAPIKWI